MLPLLINSAPGAYMASLTLNALDGGFMPSGKVTIRQVTVLAPLVGVVYAPGAAPWAGGIYCLEYSPDDYPHPPGNFSAIPRRYCEGFTAGLVGGMGSVAISDQIIDTGGRIRYQLTNSADFGKIVVQYQVG